MPSSNFTVLTGAWVIVGSPTQAPSSSVCDASSANQNDANGASMRRTAALAISRRTSFMLSDDDMRWLMRASVCSRAARASSRSWSRATSASR